MEQAYFSEIRNKIIPFLNNATDKIQVAMAWFTSSELFGALLDALNRNVDVELVLWTMLSTTWTMHQISMN